VDRSPPRLSSRLLQVFLDEARAQVHVDLDQRLIADALEPVHLARLDDEEIATSPRSAPVNACELPRKGRSCWRILYMAAPGEGSKSGLVTAPAHAVTVNAVILAATALRPGAAH
jgi:hypothetical protein